MIIMETIILNDYHKNNENGKWYTANNSGSKNNIKSENNITNSNSNHK